MFFFIYAYKPAHGNSISLVEARLILLDLLRMLSLVNSL